MAATGRAGPDEPSVTCLRYRIGGATVSQTVEGEVRRGRGGALVDDDDDLSAVAPWHADGYTVAPILDAEAFRLLAELVVGEVWGLVEASGGAPSNADRRLVAYHQAVDDRVHQSVVEAAQNGFPASSLGGLAERVAASVSDACGVEVGLRWPMAAAARSAAAGEARYCVRIVRPGRADHNPPHRDVWLDRLRHAINLYLPICGSDERSALGMIPGSHLWREDAIVRTQEGSVVDGTRFTVPCVVDGPEPLALHRPNPQPGEGTVFSPYLVHGGARNLRPDATRVSVEMRFWRDR